MSIFPVVAPFEQLEADELARAEDVMYNFNLLRVWANGLALPATGWGVDGHGDLSASTAQMHSATSVKITDAGGYYTGGTVEAALQEAGADIAGLAGRAKYITGAKLSGNVVLAADGLITGLQVTVSAGAATAGVLILISGGSATSAGGGPYTSQFYAMFGGSFVDNQYFATPRYSVSQGGVIDIASSGAIVYLAADGWDNTGDVTIDVYAKDVVANHTFRYVKISVFSI